MSPCTGSEPGAAAQEHSKHAAAAFCWKHLEPLQHLSCMQNKSAFANVQMGVSGLSCPVHIHECAFHVSVMLQSPCFFSSQLLLSYGNSPLPPNIFSRMPGSRGWSRVLSEVSALSWEKKTSSGDLGSLR